MIRALSYIIGLGLLIVSVYGFTQVDRTISVENKTATTTDQVIDEPSVPASEMVEQATRALIEEAINAKSEEIEAAKNKAAKGVEDRMKLDIEREVREQLGNTNKAKIVEIDKQTKEY